ncbi:MAG: IPT/TIG domain-containing protein [Opitutaceae bacterium]|jgi:hypothetical protein|nr:IPT/TIG domain-containing protein [Opitutaceae bacterium]
MKTTASMKTTTIPRLPRLPRIPRLHQGIAMLFPSMFIALCLAAPSARAALIASDDFDSYTPGASLIGQSAGGAGWDAAWSTGNAAAAVITISNAPADRISHTLDNGDVLGSDTSGSVLIISSTATAATDYSNMLLRNFATAPDAGADVFLSFIFKIKNLAQADGERLTTNALTAWFARDAAAHANDTAGLVGLNGQFGAGFDANRSFVTGNLNNGQTYFAVVKYTGWDGTAYRTCQVWLNPSIADETTTNSAKTVTRTESARGSTAMTGLRVRTFGITAIDTATPAGRYQIIDAIRVGTTWADVVGVPTPVTQPAITGITSASSLSALRYGDQITIAGSNFSATTVVTIGGVTATATLDADTPDTKMSVAIPVAAVGADLEVVAANGDLTATAAQKVTILAREPAVTDITPVNGLHSGDAIAITGENFSVGAPSVTIGGYAATVTPDENTPDTLLTARIPADAVGAALAVIVTNAHGNTTATQTLSVTALTPVITGITPNPAWPGDTITITGENFINPVVTIGAYTVSVIASTATGITATVPAEIAVGEYTLTVTTEAGPATGSLAITLAPSVTSVLPVQAAPGELVTLTGKYLGGATVTIGGVRAIVYQAESSDTVLKVFVPDAPAGGVITLTAAGGAAGETTTVENQFEVGAPGVQLAADDFESDIYTADSDTWITGKDGGSGWGGPWLGRANTLEVITGADSITHTLDDGTVIGGGKALKLASNHDKALARPLAQPVANGADVFLSFIFKIKSNAGDGETVTGNVFSSWAATTDLSIASGSYDAGTLGIVGVNGRVAARVRTPDAATTTNINATLLYGETYFCIVKYGGWDGARYTQCRVWLNPGAGDEYITDTGKAVTVNKAGNGSTGMGGIGVRTYGLGNGAYHIIDAIRVGTSWTSVISVSRPIVAEISPTDTHPGEIVTLGGGGFASLQAATIGGHDATIVSVTNATIKLLVPSEAVGAGREITLITGSGAITLAERLNVAFAPPRVDAISFAGATVARNQTITISGFHFTGLQEVRIAGIAVTPVTQPTNEEIRVKVPADAPAGPADISVTTTGGAFTQTGAFTVDPALFPPIVVTGAQASENTLKPGDLITIKGDNFAAPATVRVNGIVAGIISIDDGEIVAVIPEGAAVDGATEVSVETGGGTASVSNTWVFSTLPVLTRDAPERQLAVNGSARRVDLVATATASPDLAIQWQYCHPQTGVWLSVTGAENSGVTTGTLRLGPSGKDGWQLRCAFTTRLGKVYSQSVALKVMDDLIPAPSGLAVTTSPDFTIFVSDTTRHTIQTIPASGSIALLAGQAGAPGDLDDAGAAAQFNKPRGLTLDSAGLLLVADSGNHALRAVTSGGAVTTVGTGIDAVFAAPGGLAALDAAAGATYIADTGNHLVKKMLPSGEVSIVAGSGNPGAADGSLLLSAFDSPASVAVDASGGYVYVADTQNHVIRLIDLTAGAVSTFAGQTGQAGRDDGDAALAKFNQPGDLVVDDAGDVYVADTGNSLIRVITTDASHNRIVLTLAGDIAGFKDGAGADAWFNKPTALALKGGDLYVADTGNGAIRRIASDEAATVTTLEVHGMASGTASAAPPPDIDAHGFTDNGGSGGGGAPSPWLLAALSALAAPRLLRRRR